MRQRLRRDKPDVVNVHSLAAPWWIAARLAGATNAKIVVMSYAADERSADLLPGRVRRWLHRSRVGLPARALFPFADGIWCVNSEDARYYRSSYGISAGRIRVIPHAVGDFFLLPSSLSRDWNRLLFVGTWIPRKGADVLARMIAIILATIPSVRVTLAGVMVPAATVLSQFPSEAVSRLTVHEVLDDTALRDLYNSSALLLVPSRLEGLPFSLLEALAGGCPSLSATNSGMLDVIRDGFNGWLQRGHDPNLWASRVIALLQDRPSLEKASNAARISAENFRLGALSELALRWYESL